MAALLWLLIPVAAGVVASVWGGWAARRRTVPDTAGVAGYERFRAAMARTHGDTGEPAAPAASTPRRPEAPGRGRKTRGRARGRGRGLLLK